MDWRYKAFTPGDTKINNAAAGGGSKSSAAAATTAPASL